MNNAIRHIGTLLATATALAPACLAQCGSTQSVDLVSGFNALPTPSFGVVQPGGSAWSFHITTLDGPLMAGGTLGGLSAWITPGQPFTVPCVGPAWSPTNPQFADRIPSFSGLMCHPGYEGFDNFIVFTPQRPIVISAINVPVEIVGDVSDGSFVSVGLRRANGTDLTLIPSTFVPYTTAGFSQLAPAGGVLPITVNAGERVWMRTNLNVNPFEDWVNSNPAFTIAGGPVVIAPPLDLSPCPGSTARLNVVAAGSGPLTYQWVGEDTPGSGFTPIVDGPAETGGVISGAQTPSLSKTQMSGADSTRIAVIVTNACGVSYMTDPVNVVVPSCSGCAADFDGSGGTPDATDISAFFLAWLAGDGCADVDCSGGTPDATDIDAFFTLWLAGGC